jgi:hypothetical protein
MGTSLAGYERGTVVMMPLEATTPIPFKQERDRCYAIVLRIQPGSTLSNRVRRDGVTVGDGAVGSGENAQLHEQGGSAWFCPLVAASKPLHIYYVMPSDRRLGHGQVAVEVWSKKMPARWVREELENRRIADRFLGSQKATQPTPACLACGDQFDRCIEGSSDGNVTYQCALQRTNCWYHYHCL